MPRGDTLQIVIQAVDRATKTLNKVARGTIVATNKMTAAFKRVEASVFSLRGALAALGAGYVAKQFLDTAASFEKSRIMLDRLMGSAQKGREAFRWILDFGAKAPQGVEAVTDAFVKLKTAGIDPTNGSLEALVDALSAYGKGAEDLKLASVAIQQMMAKGVVSMEELRQQLAERIPDAIQIMADELGLSQQEFQKLVSQGVIPAKEALDALFRGLREKYGGASEEFAQSFSGMVQQLKAQWQLFKLDVMDKGPFLKLKALLKTVLDFVKRFRTEGDLSEWGQRIAAVATSAGKLIVKGIYYVGKAFLGLKIVWQGLVVAWDKTKQTIYEGLAWLAEKIAAILDKLATGLDLVRAKSKAAKVRSWAQELRGFAREKRGQAEVELGFALQDDIKDLEEAVDLVGEYESLAKEWAKDYEENLKLFSQATKESKKFGEETKKSGQKASQGLKIVDQQLQKNLDKTREFVHLMSLDEDQRKIEQAWLKFKQHLDVINEALKQGLINQEEAQNLTDQLMAAWEKYKAGLEDNVTETTSIFEQSWKTAFERVQGWLADFFYSFKLDLKSLGDLFRRVFAEMAAKATMQRFAGAFGLGAFVPGAPTTGGTGGFSWTNILGGVKSLWGAISNPQVALASFFGNMPWDWAQRLGLKIINMSNTAFSGLLGGATAIIGGLLTGDWARSIGSGIGAALGNIVLPGIGGLVGGLLGGLIGGLFHRRKYSKLRVGETIVWNPETGFSFTNVRFIETSRKWDKIWDAMKKSQKKLFEKWNEEIKKLLSQMPTDLAALFTDQLRQMRVYVEDEARSHKHSSDNEREIREFVQKVHNAIQSGVRGALENTAKQVEASFEKAKRQTADYLGISLSELEGLIQDPGALATATMDQALASVQAFYNALSQVRALFAEFQKRELNIFIQALSEAFQATDLDDGLEVFERSLSETVYRAVVDGFLKAVVQKGIFDKLLAPLLFQFEQLAGKFLSGGLSLDQYTQALQDLVPSLEQVLAQASEAAKPVLEAVYALRTSWPGLENTQTLPTSTTQTIYVQIDARGSDPEELAAAIKQLSRYGEVSVA